MQVEQGTNNSSLLVSNPHLSPTQLIQYYQTVKEAIEAAGNRNTVEQWKQIFQQCSGQETVRATITAICNYLTTLHQGHSLRVAFTSLVALWLATNNQQINAQKKGALIAVVMKAQYASLNILPQIVKNSDDKGQLVLNLTNDMLVGWMGRGKVTGLSMTHTVLVACQTLNEHPRNSSLCGEALRHLVIIDTIQQNQVVDMILGNTRLIDVVFRVGSFEPVSGYWYHLLAIIIRSYRVEAHPNSSQKVNNFLINTYRSVMGRVSESEQLSKEIEKLKQSSKSEQQKKYILQQIRGLVSFYCSYLDRTLRECQPDQKEILLLEQLMGLRDFFTFGECIRVYNKMSAWTALTLPVIDSIQRNCLPIHTPYKSVEYLPETIMLLANSFQEPTNIGISEATSAAMESVLGRILQLRFSHDRARICECFDKGIHCSIQRQYDRLFSAHEFLSSCYLMCRQIERVAKLNPTEEEVQSLKNYIVTNAKWLLNLSQSCQPEHRKCINLQIVTLILTFPSVMDENEFLREVVQDLVIKKLPSTKQFIGALAKRANVEQKERMRDKIKERLESEEIDIKSRVELWGFVITAGKDSEEYLKCLAEESSSQWNCLAKAIYSSRMGIQSLSRMLKVKTDPLIQSIRHHPFLYTEMNFLQ